MRPSYCTRDPQFKLGLLLATDYHRPRRTGARPHSLWYRLGAIPPRYARATAQKQGFPKSLTLPVARGRSEGGAIA